MEAKYTLTINTYIDNNDAMDLANANLSMSKDANEDITIICNNDELVKDGSEDFYIDTTNFITYEFDKMGETLVSDKINNDDLKMLFELFNANEENTMKEESTLRNLYTPKEYDRETGAFIYEVFQVVAEQCKYHSEDMFEIDSEEEINFELNNSEDYMAECMSDDDFHTYGKSIYSDGAIYILIHGHESNIGMMNWMSDFRQFETLTNTIMELVAGVHGMNCVIRDKDFAKEQFEMVQQMVQKQKAA